MTSSDAEGIDAVIGLLTRLAAGDLAARGDRPSGDEDLDAVVVGINMLAEELEAHRSELEARVLSRTVELEAARKEAMEASRLKSEFLATMSHEIRTPMNGVVGLTRLLLHTQLDETQLQYAEGLQNAGEALLNVINDILDFSKLEAGMVDLELTDFDPRRLVEGVAGLLGLTSSRKGLELIAYCAPEVPARLVGDEGRLRQILLNLASNAVKFTDKGEVVITASVTDETDAGDRARVRFQVTDTGIGIPENAQRALFDSFTQADASTTRRYGGTGLGLAISRSLTETMGGTIGLTSEEGTGSTFWFEVPLAVSSTAPPPEAGHDVLHGLRALVVDDNATNRLVLESQLTEWGLRVDVVEHPAAVVPLLRAAVAAEDPVAVAVLDMCMPELDGLELARLVTADASLHDTLLLMLSSTMDVDRDELRRAGVQDFLGKPVRAADLLDRLVRLVAEAPDPGDRIVRRTDPEPTGARTGRVLVVEDNTVNQLVAEGLVAHLGYEVDIVEDGAEAVDAVERKRYAVVLMDCHMPVMDGYSATEEIRRRETDAGAERVPIVAMTAGATADDRARCLAAGMDDYVSKPIDTTALVRALQRWARPEPPPGTAEPEAGAVVEPVALDPERLAVLRGIGAPPDGLLPALGAAFLAGSPALLATMRRALADGDPTALQRAAHELAGSAANIGAVAVAALAARAEHPAPDRQSAVTPALLDDIEHELGRVAVLLG